MAVPPRPERFRHALSRSREAARGCARGDTTLVPTQQGADRLREAEEGPPALRGRARGCPRRETRALRERPSFRRQGSRAESRLVRAEPRETPCLQPPIPRRARGRAARTRPGAQQTELRARSPRSAGLLQAVAPPKIFSAPARTCGFPITGGEREQRASTSPSRSGRHY